MFCCVICQSKILTDPMPISIKTNIASLAAQRSIANSNQNLQEAFNRLSTGKRVNASADDAVALSVASKIDARVSGINQAVKNLNDGVSMVEIAEGALDETTSILQRMRDLAVQSANGSLSLIEQSFLQTEHNKLAANIDSISSLAEFNGKQLLTVASNEIQLQSGADESDTVSISFPKISAETLGVSSELINLTGAAQGSETVTFNSFSVGQAATTINFGEVSDITNQRSGDIWEIKINSVDFTLSTNGWYTNTTQMVNDLNNNNNAVTPGYAALSDLGVFSMVGSDLVFTFGLPSENVNQYSGGINSITSRGNQGGSIPTFENPLPTVVNGQVLQASQGAGDVYTLTVGSSTYATSAATDSSDFNTNKKIADALQATLDNEGVTAFSISTAGGIDTGAIVLRYSSNGNQVDVTYKLEKTSGTATANDTSPSITNGASTPSDAITRIDSAINSVSQHRSELGANHKQLLSTTTNLINIAENSRAAMGRIIDADIASETAKLTKHQIMSEAATAVLAQANSQPEEILRALKLD